MGTEIKKHLKEQLGVLDERRKHNEMMLKNHTVYDILHGLYGHVEEQLNRLHRENKHIEIVDVTKAAGDAIVMTVKVVRNY